MPELRGRVALVTGGGRGLGEAICESLAGAGATVMVADLREDTAAAVAKRLSGDGPAAFSVALDVADEQSVNRAIDETIRQCGALDILVNNAGTDLTVSIPEMPTDDWDRILAVNLRGPFLTSRRALDVMAAQEQRGHIVNIVSTAAKRAWANASAYHASKWGLLGFTHALHVEGRQQGIKVTAVLAGGMRTPFLLDRFPDLDPGLLQDPKNVADTVRYVLTQPAETVIPEVMVLPMRETSWP